MLDTTHDTAAWHIEVPDSHRFRGGINYRSGINISTLTNCKDICLLSNLPIIAGHYNWYGQYGVYYEITVNRMDSDAVVAIGMLSQTCNKYPIVDDYVNGIFRIGLSTIPSMASARVEQTEYRPPSR